LTSTSLSKLLLALPPSLSPENCLGGGISSEEDILLGSGEDSVKEFTKANKKEQPEKGTEKAKEKETKKDCRSR
jgi:hypothetical protein